MASLTAAHAGSASGAGASVNAIGGTSTSTEGENPLSLPESTSTSASMGISASAAMEESSNVIVDDNGRGGGNRKSCDLQPSSTSSDAAAAAADVASIRPGTRNNSVALSEMTAANNGNDTNEDSNTKIINNKTTIPPVSDATSKPTNNMSSTNSNSTSASSDRGEQTISYSAERIIGNGSFGVVFQAAVVETGEIVAIKKVLQDKRFKNRELQIMRLLVKDPHSNIVALKHCFYSQGEKPDELYLNLVLEFVAETVYSISRQHQRRKVTLPLLYVKLYLYQLSRALSHIHAMGICHRDIKPQNLLVDPRTQQLKLCDFGSAKALVKGEPNVSYICSRYYRAPELIFGSTDYSTAIDVWSQGCVGAELLLGQPLFPGDSGVDQLVEIIKVLGTPTREEISAMNSNYTEFKFPQIKACQWRKVFRSETPVEAMEFIGSTLAYSPTQRVKPLQGCAHSFFDELRDVRTRLPNGDALPPLFDFTVHELNSVPDSLEKLIPAHVKALDQKVHEK